MTNRSRESGNPMIENEKYFFHDGRLIFLNISRQSGKYNIQLVLDLYESIDTGNKLTLSLKLVDVFDFKFLANFTIMEENFIFGNIEDGEINFHPEFYIKLKFTKGVLKIKSMQYFIDKLD